MDIKIYSRLEEEIERLDIPFLDLDEEKIPAESLIGTDVSLDELIKEVATCINPKDYDPDVKDYIEKIIMNTTGKYLLVTKGRRPNAWAIETNPGKTVGGNGDNIREGLNCNGTENVRTGRILSHAQVAVSYIYGDKKTRKDPRHMTVVGNHQFVYGHGVLAVPAGYFITDYREGFAGDAIHPNSVKSPNSRRSTKGCIRFSMDKFSELEKIFGKRLWHSTISAYIAPEPIYLFARR